MHAILYRWTVGKGSDEAFKRGWRDLTESIRAQCGSFGSRLHRTDDGAWVAYAFWPDRATWEACSPDDPVASARLAEAISASDDPVHLDIVDDRIGNASPQQVQ